MFNHDNRFDIDLAYGQQGEAEALAAIRGKVEVKTERDTWRKTGNIAIEYESRGKPSGIAVTQADYWAHLLMEGGAVRLQLWWPINELKELSRYHYINGKTCCGGDNNTSKLILIPLQGIF